MSRKTLVSLVIALAVVAIGVLAFFSFGRKKLEVVYIDSDRTIQGDFAVAATQQVVLAKGAKLTVTGSMTVDGELVCEGGSIQASVGGEFKVSNKVSCPDITQTTGIAISAKTFTIEKTATIVSAGSVQLVDQPSKLLVAEALDKTFDAVESDSGAGNRVGPLTSATGLRSSASAMPSLAEHNDGVYHLANAVLGVASVSAQAPVTTISGDWQIIGEGETSPAELNVERASPKIKKILLNFSFGENSDVRLQDFTLSGPNGSHGNNVYDTCSALGGRGGDAMRLNVQAANLTINNLYLTLGSGGEGGIAKTSKDCENAFATGGEGGKPGNFKMVATGNFSIGGAFEITPGRGGAGGLAEATGKNAEAACPGKNGGNATATGGKGGDSLQTLGSTGTVGGLGNVSVGDVQAGRGGDAIATSGNGGAGNACGCAGGNAGKAVATAGNGGRAVESGASAAFSVSEGGDGGDATSNAGHGGNGGSCGPDKKGGKGGVGGDSKATAGKAGVGGDQSGTDGNVNKDQGGNGGNGGDGCMPGRGGLAGSPSGTPGQLGKITCIIEVIKPKDQYLLTDGLHVAGADACAESHWHGTATATDGTVVSDPNPGACGHCAVSQCPVIKGEVASPFFSSEAEEQLRNALNSATVEWRSIGDAVKAMRSPAVTTPSARVEIRGGIFGN